MKPISILLIALVASISGSSQRPSSAIAWTSGGLSVIEADLSATLTPGSAVAVRVMRTEAETTRTVAKSEDVPTCTGPHSAGELCKEIEGGRVSIKYWAAVETGQKCSYSLVVLFTDAKKGDVAQILKPDDIIAVDKAIVRPLYKSEVSDFKIVHIIVHHDPNGEILVSIRPAISKEGLTAEAKQEYEDEFRNIYRWLELHRSDPSSIGKIVVDPQDREGSSAFSIQALRLEPGNVDSAWSEDAIDLILVPERQFPMGKYDFQVEFGNDAPPELRGTYQGTQTGFVPKDVDPTTVGLDKTMGLRERKASLDLGIAFTSSQNIVKVGTASVRKRQSNAVVDLRLAPILNYHRDGDDTNFFTPFFIDAKVSSGKIDNTTLALNRINIGSEYSLKWAPVAKSTDNAGHEIQRTSDNTYVFSFRAISKSDRDFKRAEAEAEIEFRPYIYALNYALSSHIRHPLAPGNLIPAHTKQIPCCEFGYQIRPLIGMDLGGVYRAKRTALDVPPTSRTVKRLYFGGEATIDLTRHVTLHGMDTLYVRGESPRHRTRNYFKGEVRVPILTTENSSQCLFLSYEKGDQPPFSTPTVNAVKLGYRITVGNFDPPR
jgi:hypothetical protein